MSYKALEDFSPEEVAQAFVTDCLVPPGGNTVVPEAILVQLARVYCEQIGVATPNPTSLKKVIRRTYTSTVALDGKTCFRLAIKPGLIQEG